MTDELLASTGQAQRQMGCYSTHKIRVSAFREVFSVTAIASKRVSETRYSWGLSVDLYVSLFFNKYYLRLIQDLLIV